MVPIFKVAGRLERRFMRLPDRLGGPPSSAACLRQGFGRRSHFPRCSGGRNSVERLAKAAEETGGSYMPGGGGG